ncbi:FmdB family zinc ribbon protein [Desulfomicrobium orale]|uniref:FmdB family transcriptional regulator n=1 Tax=Desulfomicrobium orale DSM 12838 TaxID=888061 RepID=A0A0X8JPL2_9BACT|nr:zinc ribbon domain-containing protein [Desulfomicrobium orale]AMD92589.1 FmdB family transcriptional regulator [Desulfomicrobium orale DSM 12838]MDO4768590.1 zinc ribbon domain-containing protein [Pseudomonadota bacterium]
MPIYEYTCEDCHQIFEEWQKDFQDRAKTCPVCGGAAHRLISSTSFVLKGGGWYASGYTKETGGNGKKESSSATDSSQTTAS